MEVKPCSHFSSEERKHHRRSHSTNTCIPIICQSQGLGKRDMELSQLDTPIVPRCTSLRLHHLSALPALTCVAVIVSEHSSHFSPVPLVYSKHSNYATPLFRHLCILYVLRINPKLFYGLINAVRPVPPTAPNLQHALCSHWLPARPLNKPRDFVFAAVVAEYHTLINL